MNQSLTYIPIHTITQNWISMVSLFHFESDENNLTNGNVFTIFKLPEHISIKNQIYDFLKLRKTVNEIESQNPIFQKIEPIQNKTFSNIIQGRYLKFDKYLKFFYKDNLNFLILFIKNKNINNEQNFLKIPHLLNLEYKKLDAIQLKIQSIQVLENNFTMGFTKDYNCVALNKKTELKEKIIISCFDFQDFKDKTWDPIIYMIREIEIQNNFIKNSKSPNLLTMIDYFVIYNTLKPHKDFRLYTIYPEYHISLREIIEERRSMKKPATGFMILKLAKDILDGLYSLHKLNIAHRDVKPENIVFDYKSKNYKLKSFGLYKKNEESLNTIFLKTASLTGTPFYLSLDYFKNLIIKDKKLYFSLDIMKGDIYSLGVIIIELLSLILEPVLNIPSNSLYEILDQRRLNDIDTFCDLCEKKFLFHNYLISILK